MSEEKHYAHTPNEKTGAEHELEDHLKCVAEKAKEFAEVFETGNLAYWSGLWHDLGKFNPKFRKYLEDCKKGKHSAKTPHAIWGAALAYQLSKKDKREIWKETALPIAGHHTGLQSSGTVSQKIVESISESPDLFKKIAAHAKSLPSPPKIPLFNHSSLQREFRIRMLFSALVDADYLDTEKHFKPELASVRNQFPAIKDLLPRFDENQQKLLEKLKKAEKAEGTDALNQIRKEVYECCLKAAYKPPGIYRLTVPTGGGKTRSGLAFALKHAMENDDMRRVIFAIPYTSIIDQTAQEYRKILRAEAVLEHHSQVSVREDAENYTPEQYALQLAMENWESPVIVTTTVQLFDSLFSNKPSRVRKLHNLAKSVILIDEVQTLPPELLTPILEALKILAEQYRATIVLCTATQPVFEDSRYLKPFQDICVHEIIPKEKIAEHFQKLSKRVVYERRNEPVSWESLAEEIRSLSQVMVILNTRKNALALVEQLELKKQENVFHLSTLLCGAHRRIILRKVKKRLRKGLPVKLLSTQVVEAGVDIDFPFVYRAMGPLDRIVQAAGRCNREWAIPDGKPGRVVIFEPEQGRTPKGTYKTGFEKAKLLFTDHDCSELHQPELYQLYFERLFADIDTDKNKIQEFQKQLDYPKVAENFHLIEQDTCPVLIDCNSALKRLKTWKTRPSRKTWQRLQPLVVNIFKNDAERLEYEGWLDKVSEGLYRSFGKYDERKGLVHVINDPSDLNC